MRRRFWGSGPALARRLLGIAHRRPLLRLSSILRKIDLPRAHVAELDGRALPHGVPPVLPAICGTCDERLASTSDDVLPRRRRRRIDGHGRSGGEWRRCAHNFDKLAEEAPPGEVAKNSTAGTVGDIVSARDNAAPPAGRLGCTRVARLSLFDPSLSSSKLSASFRPMQGAYARCARFGGRPLTQLNCSTRPRGPGPGEIGDSGPLGGR
jgi:hypothetical protein